MNRFKFVTVLALIMLGGAWNVRMTPAQDIEVQLATEEEPHYVGVPVTVQLSVDGLGADPEPVCKAEASSDNVRIRLAGISPRIMQQVYQSGGQVRRIQHVSHTIQFRVTASQPGEYKVGPFSISQNGVEKTVDAITMSFQDVPVSDNMRIKLLMPESAYPDQRVPITIEWWIAGRLDNVHKLDIDASPLDQFHFAPDQPASRGESRLPIHIAGETIPLAAEVRTETVDDKEFTVVTAKRILIPSRPGSFSIAPITATIQWVTAWQQRRSFGGFSGSLFDEAFGGGRRPANIELFRSESDQHVFTVKPFPTANRPESFAGAVGSGFSLELAADRTVVRAGDPIRLTLTLRGDGNIEGATLPVLSADSSFNNQSFRLPDGDIAGVFDPDTNSKQFTVSVRVLDESVNEIPAVSYSWFDTGDEAYRTTRSQPIALNVMPSKMVGADSVVSSRQGPASPKDLMNDTEGTQRSQSESTTRSLSGADLAIERDPSKLLSEQTRFFENQTVRYSPYALGCLFVVVAWVDRRRRQVDPETRRAIEVIAAQKRRIQEAKALPEKEAARQIAESLRTAIVQCPNGNREAADRIHSECENLAFKPSSGIGDRNEQLVKNALAALQTLHQGGAAE